MEKKNTGLTLNKVIEISVIMNNSRSQRQR